MRTAPLLDPVLEDITRTIVDAFRPTRIVLFGSRARGDGRGDSDYDLMVELDTDRDRREVWSDVHSAVSHLGGRGVDIKIRRLGEFERKRDDPGTIDYDIAREGIVLHPPGLRGPMEQGRRVVKESPPEPPESVAVWLERADADLLIVDQLLDAESPVWMGVAFHAQQAAEKYLKALLISHWRKPPRTHVLAELVVALRNAGCSLPDLSDECQTLKPYCVAVRYPEDQAMPTEAAGRAAVAAAGRIVAAVRAQGIRQR